MNRIVSTAEKAAYCQAANTGMYQKPMGLLGKYDNVRRFWEDRITSRFLAPALNELVLNKVKKGKGISALDLGCGAGDGIDLLYGIHLNGANLSKPRTALLNDTTFERLVGLDLNEDLLEQARTLHGTDPKLRFIQGDLSHGLPAKCLEMPPFDLYFAGYGTLSHFHDDQTVNIITDIAGHASPGAIFVGDWLGRYSYEWVDLWNPDTEQELFMDYRISYIYDEEQRNHADISSFPLRLMSRDEVMAMVSKAQAQSGYEIEPLLFFDRSLLVGRHMDTGDYNGCPPRTRVQVNSLFERNMRTDLNDLIVDYNPSEGFDTQNRFFESYFRDSNQLTQYTRDLLEGAKPSLDPGASAALKEAADIMAATFESVNGLNCFDARANTIEPTLGYCLRKLEMDLQPGLGMGHGLVGVFRINK
jgi:SAM-dependent methyltransferase